MKRMCKYMYNRARNHRVNFGNILDKAVSMVKVLDDQKEGNPGYLGDLQECLPSRPPSLPFSLPASYPSSPSRSVSLCFL